MPSVEADAVAREIFCRLLAACYYQPGAEFAEERVFPSMHEAATAIDAELAATASRLAPTFAAMPADELLLDYTRLFLGPNDILAKPYGSVWLSGEKPLMQNDTMAVLDLYRQGGFELADDFRELPDHVAAELEFLYLLIFRENRARRDGDEDALASATGLRRRLLAEHLGRWMPPFTAAMRQNATSDFYRHVADLTGRFTALERERRP
jgi:putative dimethyl sulfoxide reductase chaperone